MASRAVIPRQGTSFHDLGDEQPRVYTQRPRLAGRGCSIIQSELYAAIVLRSLGMFLNGGWNHRYLVDRKVNGTESGSFPQIHLPDDFQVRSPGF